MNVLYLTNNAQLAGTARILMTWLTLGRESGLSGAVVIPRAGELQTWLDAHQVPLATSSMPWVSRWWPVPAFTEALRLARWARAHHVDLVHCNEHDVYPFGVMVARLLRRPIVCHVRFLLPAAFARWAFGGWRQPDALLWTTNQQRIDSADAIAGIVPTTRQHLIPLGPNPLTFRPDAADRQAMRARLEIQDGELAIGAATALRPVKRLGDFVDLVASLARSHPQIVGLIAGGAVDGEEEYSREIERRIAATGLGRRLRWVGHLEPVEGFLRALDIFASTSEYETFGNSVCEAMACGVPAVAYVGGSVHEIIGGAGIVVPNGDLPALAAAVESLIEDDGLRLSLARLGQARVASTFNPRKSFELLQRVYASVQEAGPVRGRGRS
jgi:glycosyltransferase involved in cell wall biosynthesis